MLFPFEIVSRTVGVRKILKITVGLKVNVMRKEKEFGSPEREREKFEDSH